MSHGKEKPEDSDSDADLWAGAVTAPSDRQACAVPADDQQWPGRAIGRHGTGICARPRQTACGFIRISPGPTQAAQPVWEIPADAALIAGADPGTCPDGRDATAFTNPFTGTQQAGPENHLRACDLLLCSGGRI